ncbi:Uncharacterised protein [Mycobacterium tuberculosis]|nr:Uncharacterised protein [Mycobacterium tuberculosis]
MSAMDLEDCALAAPANESAATNAKSAMRVLIMRISCAVNKFGVPPRPDGGPRRERRAYFPVLVTFTAPFMPAS